MTSAFTFLFVMIQSGASGHQTRLCFSTKSFEIIRGPMNVNICMEECTCLEAMMNLMKPLIQLALYAF